MEDDHSESNVYVVVVCKLSRVVVKTHLAEKKMKAICAVVQK